MHTALIGTGTAQGPERPEASIPAARADSVERTPGLEEIFAADTIPRMRSGEPGSAPEFGARLEEAGFQVGDRILLSVRGLQELSDTFTVRPGPGLDLPGIGEVPLAGVPRSDIEEHLKRHLARVIRDPTVRAHGLVRVAVLGEINQPGYFDLPTLALLTDALMTAGGPTRAAELTRLWVQRGNRRILEGAALQEAIARSRTLEDLQLRTGDRIMVPERARLGSDEWLRLAIVALPTLIFSIRELF